MIVSHLHKYVYIGIPRTGSKSMNHWLIEYFDGKWHGEHHDRHVSAEFAGYLVFTMVRNPYDRAVSKHFAVYWDDQGAKPEEIGPCKDPQERLRKSRAILKGCERQMQRPMPEPPPVPPLPLEQLVREAKLRNQGDGNGVSQKRFVEKSGAKLVLYFERLPACLKALPFVDPENVPPFPHHPERGIRPAGNYFDFFRSADEEQAVWAYEGDDFAAFGYRRFDCGLPEGNPDAMWIGER